MPITFWQTYFGDCQTLINIDLESRDCEVILTLGFEMAEHSIIRDMVGKDEAAWDKVVQIVCCFNKIIETAKYLTEVEFSGKGN